MRCDTLKNKDGSVNICENYKPEHNARMSLQKKYFLIKIQKLKKGPLRGTPHNLSKVSLEVKGLDITRKYTATSEQFQN